MHMGNLVHDSILFIGWEDHSSPSGIKCAGTAFLIHYAGAGFLITAGHVARTLEGAPFVLRANRNNRAELLESGSGKWKWRYHSDPLVDLAAVPFTLTEGSKFQAKYLPESMICTNDVLADEGIDVGDLCYTVGLFHFVHGQERNMPMVHSGSIALMPPVGERIPVGNKTTGKTDWVEGYLIESRAINGASGSPVFARPAIAMKDMPLDNGEVASFLVSNARLYLLGVFQSAWFLPPDDPVRNLNLLTGNNVVPVGIGVVVPATKIVELLETEPLKSAPKIEAIIPAQPAGIERPDSQIAKKRDEALARALRTPPQGKSKKDTKV